ncbi:MAG: hypothetical protein MZW92_65905 [Comamonadaceae bacterium]|nr:hypothetical protein [Comamonadaceae bacterium]
MAVAHRHHALPAHAGCPSRVLRLPGCGLRGPEPVPAEAPRPAGLPHAGAGGYSSGATLVYAVLAQAPPNTFGAAVSMDFDPTWRSASPCAQVTAEGLAARQEPGGQPGQNLLPATALQNPRIALQGTIDQVCAAADVVAYVKQVPKGQIVLLPDVGHGFSVPRHWPPQSEDIFSRLRATGGGTPAPQAGDKLADLPLVETAPRAQAGDTLAVIVSGAGGPRTRRQVGAPWCRGRRARRAQAPLDGTPARGDGTRPRAHPRPLPAHAGQASRRAGGLSARRRATGSLVSPPRTACRCDPEV